jgi:hypothetical protein
MTTIYQAITQTKRNAPCCYTVAESVVKPGAWIAYYITTRSLHTVDIIRDATSAYLAKCACEGKAGVLTLPWRAEEV